MERKRKLPDHRKQKYLRALLELYERTKEATEISLMDFIKEFNLNSRLSEVLRENKLIIEVGAEKRVKLFKWNTIRPTIMMAEKVLEECRKLDIEWREKNKEITKEIKITPKTIKSNKDSIIKSKNKPYIKKQDSNVCIKLREVSIFWGMFRLTY